jgi:hypothetical protein
VRVHGVLVVRDGVGTVRAALLHHLSLGCERIHVVDNGSTDGTTTVLERLAARTPITWRSDLRPYDQSALTTELVHEAARAGADWVLVFDHDEFWVSERPLREVLAEAAADGVGALQVPVVNFAQHRDVARSSPRALLTMRHRAAEEVAPEQGQALFEADELSYLEIAYTPKLLFRASERVDVQRGAHTSRFLEGPAVPATGIEVLHAPLAARSELALKAAHGERLLEAGYSETESWHVRRWALMARSGRLHEAWPSLSVDDDGCIELPGGRRHRFVRDTRLSDTVSRYVRSPFKQAAARLLARSY